MRKSGLLLLGVWLALAGAASAAGTKTGLSGTNTITLTDDLPSGGATGSAGLSGAGGISVTGAIGQVGTLGLTGSGVTLEPGYFAKAVQPAASVLFNSVSVTSMTVSWSDPGNPAGTTYTVFYSTEPLFIVGSSVTLAPAVLTATLTGLLQSSTHYIRVRSDYAGSDSAVAPTVSTITQAVPGLFVALSTPTYPAGGVAVNVVPTLNWQGPSQGTLVTIAAAQYLIDVSNSPSFPAGSLFSATTGFTSQNGTLAFTLGSFGALGMPALSDGTTYYWRVRVQNFSGATSGFSQTASFVYDISTPTASAFASLSSTGGVIPETLTNDLIFGTSVQLSLSDAGTGLAVTANALAGGGFGVSYSSNAGASWTDSASTVAFTVASGQMVRAMAPFAGKLFAGSRAGSGAQIYFTSNGTAWTGVPPALDAADGVYALCAYNGALYAATGGSSANLYRSATGTAGWAPHIGTGVMAAENSTEACAVYNGMLFVGTRPSGDIFATDGVAPVASLASLGQGGVMALGVFNGRLFAGTGAGGILMSADGITWTQVFTTGAGTVRAFAAFNGRLYAASTSPAKVWSSADGQFWTPAKDLSAFGDSVRALAAVNGKLYAGVGNAAAGIPSASPASLWMSVDGTQWTRLASNAAEAAYTALASFNGQLLYGSFASTARIYTATPVAASIAGADGVKNAALQASGLNLAFSAAGSAGSCNGSFTCTDTNQVVFSVSDQAGNVRVAGPYNVYAPLNFSVTGFPAVSTGSLTVAFHENLAPGQAYTVQAASVASFSQTVVTSSVTLSTFSATLAGLQQNTTYYAQVLATGYAAIASMTATSIVAPQSVSVGGVFVTSLTATANAVPAFANLGAGSSGIAVSTSGFFSGFQPTATLTLTGLSPNTTYSLRAQAMNVLGATTAVSPPSISTTLAATPALFLFPPAPPLTFANISFSSFTARWSTAGNPPGTLYNAVIALDAGFTAVQASSLTALPSASFAGLAGATTYFAEVQAVNKAGVGTPFLGLGSVRTPSTALLTAVSTPTFPASSGFINTGAVTFYWRGPDAATLAAIGVPSNFEIQVSSNDPTFATTVLDSATLAAMPAGGVGTADGSFSLSTPLPSPGTYDWRVRLLDPAGAASPWSAPSAFTFNTAPPTAVAYAVLNSSNQPVSETTLVGGPPLYAGATAQFTVKDTASGLALAPAELPVIPGTAGLWHFDEGSGALAFDATGTGNNGQFAGNPVWSPGRTGQAVTFDGSSYVYVPTNPITGDDFTLELWVKTTAAGSTGSQCYFGNDLIFNDVGGLAFDWHLSVTNNTACFDTGDPNSGQDYSVFGNVPINDGNWHMVTAVRQKGVSARLYIDGVFQNSIFTDANTLPSQPFLEIGGDNINHTPFVGSIDEVRVLNTALSDGQIAADYAMGTLGFSAQYSYDGGQTWNAVSTTSLSAAPLTPGSVNPVVLSATALLVNTSTNGPVGCAGGFGCASVDQVQFAAADRAGNILVSNYAITADVTAPGIPNPSATQAGAPNTVQIAWTSPGSDGSIGTLTAGSQFLIAYSTSVSALSQPASLKPPKQKGLSPRFLSRPRVIDPNLAQIQITTGPLAPGTLVSAAAALPLLSQTTVYFGVWARDAFGNTSLQSAELSLYISPFSLAAIDAAGLANAPAALALGRAGDAHVAYASGGNILYRHLTGPAAPSVVHALVGAGAAVQIALDGNETPHVAFYDAGTDDLYYSSFTVGVGWSLSTAAFALGGVAPTASLAVDAAAHPRLAYTLTTLSGSASDVAYVQNNGSGWSAPLAITADGGGGNPALALAGDGSARVAFFDQPLSQVGFALIPADGVSAPVVTPAASASAVFPGMALALDGTGGAQIAFGDQSIAPSKLQVLSSPDGAAWTETAIDMDGGANPSLVLDGAGHPQIAYESGPFLGPPTTLRYARFNGVSWTLGTLDSTGTVSRPALALDAAGNPLVAYVAADTGVVKRASWTAGQFPPPMGGAMNSRVQAPSAFSAPRQTQVFKTSVTWSWTSNSTDETGFRLYGAVSSTGPFSLIANESALPAHTLSYTENGLARGSTYFRYVAAVNAGGVVTSSGITVVTKGGDFTPPSIDVSLQPGDSTWYRLNTGQFHAQFNDLGGSGLDFFQVKASTTPLDQGAGELTALSADGWVTAASGISNAAIVSAYTNAWSLPAAVFTALQSETTNYISLRVYDGDGNVTVSSDAFYVKKDTTPVRIVTTPFPGNVSGPFAGDPGAVFAAAFSDPGGIDTLQYSASANAGTADTGLVPWTTIVGPAYGPNSYSTPFALNFNLLRNNATNYISIRGWDLAGSTQVVKDAFVVLKDTSGPYVAISTPVDGGFRSTMSVIAGTAFDLFGVQQVQVSVLWVAAGAYWDSSAGGFTATGNPIWNLAQGTTAWTFASGAIPLNDDTRYLVVARGASGAGLYSVTYASAAFGFDTTAPSASVAQPATGAQVLSPSLSPPSNGLTVLAGTASDPGQNPSGIGAVDVSFSRLSDGLWWDFNASSWSVAQVSTVASGGAQWSVAAPPLLQASLRSNASYYVTARARDAAVLSNIGPFFSAASTFTYVDISSPDPVVDFAAAQGAGIGDIALSWHATGEDGSTGILYPATYLISMATWPMVAASTSGAAQTILISGTSAQVPTPNASALIVSTLPMVLPGAASTQAVSGLNPGGTYYFFLWTVNANGNMSLASNRARSVAKDANYLLGSVSQTGGEGLTGIVADAYDSSGAQIQETTTLPDGSGVYKFSNLPPGTYKVVVTWTVDDLSSSAGKDGLSETSTGVDFTLSIQYSLGAIQGQAQAIKPRTTGALKLAGIRKQAAEETGAFIELYSNNRLVSAAPVHPNGSYAIPHLLPATYRARIFDGQAYSPMETVKLRAGQVVSLGAAEGLLADEQVFAFPNPAKNAVTLRFASTAFPLDASISIYDVTGALVRDFSNAEIQDMGGGLYHAAWDTTNGDHKRVASGVYLFAVKVRDTTTGARKSVVKKLAIIR